jgi:hypothetical protein
MRLSRPLTLRPEDPQQTFWDAGDHPLVGPGEARHLCGEFFERGAAELAGAVRYRTDGTAEYCPDLGYGPDFIEAKAVGNSNRVLAYERRLERDARLVAEGHGLWYWIFHHEANALTAKTRRELYAMLAGHFRWSLALPWRLLRPILMAAPLKRLNTSPVTKAGERRGYGKPDYWLGRSPPLAALRAAAPARIVSRAATINGVGLPPVPLYFDPSAPPPFLEAARGYSVWRFPREL